MIKTLMFSILLLVGGAMTSVSAQKNLDKWIQECGRRDNVNYSVIVRKDKVTKNVISSITSINFLIKDAPDLITMLRDAAEKDKKDAVEVVEKKVKGVFEPEIYRFYNVGTREYTNYIFSKEEGHMSVVVTNDPQGDEEGEGYFHFEGMNFPENFPFNHLSEEEIADLMELKTLTPMKINFEK